MTGIRVLIVDDDQLFRVGLRMIVDSAPQTSVVGEGADGRAAVGFVEGHPGEVDVVLMDINMPGLDGVDATRAIVGLPDPPKVLMLTTFAEDTHVYAAITAGASGFLLKDTPPDALLAAIGSAHSGTAVVSPQLTQRLISSVVPEQQAASVPPEMRRRLEALTEREAEVLDLIARGLNNTEISQQLFIAEVTVKTHVGRVLRKLEVRDRIQAVVFAYEAGLMAGDAGEG